LRGSLSDTFEGYLERGSKPRTTSGNRKSHACAVAAAVARELAFSSHVDRSFSAKTALHLHGDGHSDRAHGHRHNHPHGYGHFSQDRHPGGERDLEFSGRRARGNGEAL